MVAAIGRVPALDSAGVKQMINGPESFTPDGNFILGEAPECANMFVGAGFNAFGIASGGGAGWALAQWAVDGEAPLDLWAVDIRRFSALHRDRDWVAERTLEAYGKHYTIAFPHEEYDSGRPRIVSPLYGRLKAHRAVFGSKLGWERPNWFAPEGTPPPTSIPWAGRTGSTRSAASIGTCASTSASSTSLPSPSSNSPDRDAAQGARLDLRQRHRQAGRPAHLHAAAQLARRHRGRSDRGTHRRRSLLSRHRHRLPHPRFRLDRRSSAGRRSTSPRPTSPKPSARCR